MPSLAFVICRRFNDGHSDQWTIITSTLMKDLVCSNANLYSRLWDRLKIKRGILLFAVVRTCLPTQETLEARVWFLGWEDPLEEEMATYSSILARTIPRTEEPGRLQSTGSQRAGHDWATEHARSEQSPKGRLKEGDFPITWTPAAGFASCGGIVTK